MTEATLSTCGANRTEAEPELVPGLLKESIGARQGAGRCGVLQIQPVLHQRYPPNATYNI